MGPREAGNGRRLRTSSGISLWNGGPWKHYLFLDLCVHPPHRRDLRSDLCRSLRIGGRTQSRDININFLRRFDSLRHHTTSRDEGLPPRTRGGGSWEAFDKLLGEVVTTEAPSRIPATFPGPQWHF